MKIFTPTKVFTFAIAAIAIGMMMDASAADRYSADEVRDWDGAMTFAELDKAETIHDQLVAGFKSGAESFNIFTSKRVRTSDLSIAYRSNRKGAYLIFKGYGLKRGPALFVFYANHKGKRVKHSVRVKKYTPISGRSHHSMLLKNNEAGWAEAAKLLAERMKELKSKT